MYTHMLAQRAKHLKRTPGGARDDEPELAQRLQQDY